MRHIKTVEIFTDGACSGNPGPGGYGVVLRFTANGKVYEKELSGGDSATTNNRMELMAVIAGLKALKKEGMDVDFEVDEEQEILTVGEFYLSDIRGLNQDQINPVSYTHLTLPTIYSV